jgi:hypothetical protein
VPLRADPLQRPGVAERLGGGLGARGAGLDLRFPLVHGHPAAQVLDADLRLAQDEPEQPGTGPRAPGIFRQEDQDGQSSPVVLSMAWPSGSSPARGTGGPPGIVLVLKKLAVRVAIDGQTGDEIVLDVGSVGVEGPEIDVDPPDFGGRRLGAGRFLRFLAPAVDVCSIAPHRLRARDLPVLGDRRRRAPGQGSRALRPDGRSQEGARGLRKLLALP